MPFIGLAICAIMDCEVLDCTRADVLDFVAQILSTGRRVRVRARGWSMYPFIRQGDVIEVESVKASAVRIGDVVLCRDGVDRFVAHRVVKVGSEDARDTLVTKGYWTRRSDPPVHPEQVLGRVVAVERGRKRIGLDTNPQRRIQVLWTRIPAYSRWLYLIVTKCERVAQRVMDKVLGSVA